MQIKDIRTFVVLVIMSTAVSTGRAGHRITTLLRLDYIAAADIHIRRNSDGNAGLAAFRMLGDKRAALLSNTGDCIMIYRTRDGRMLRTLPLPAGPRDFCATASGFFVRYSDRILEMTQDGSSRREFFLAPSLRFISRLVWIDSCLYALSAEGFSYPLHADGTPLSPDAQVRKRSRGWVLDKQTAAFPVVTGDYSGEIRLFSGSDSTAIPFHVHTTLGCLRIIGKTGSSLYLETHTITRQAPLRITRSIARFSLVSGEIIDTFEPPPCTYFGMAADLVMSGDQLLHAATGEEAIHIFGLRYDDRLAGTTFPETVPAPYHYNDHLPEIDKGGAASGKIACPGPLDPISRSAIMENADKYVKIEWYCNEPNTSHNEQITLPDGAIIQTPYWVEVGSQRRMPYKWGGFTHIDNFTGRLQANCYAGDVYTAGVNRDAANAVSAGDAYCVGVDCSGFVSRAWGLPIKQWTGSLPNISIPLEKWSEARPGDIANKIAGHVMLIVSRNSSGSMSIVHANGTYEDVSYDVKTLYDLSGYAPLKYAAVIEDGWEPEPVAWTTLHQNFPNPVLGSTTISFYTAYESDATITVFNLLGQPVAVPFTGHVEEGTHTLPWDPGDLPSGLYFYQLRTWWDTLTKKCTIVH